MSKKEEKQEEEINIEEQQEQVEASSENDQQEKLSPEEELEIKVKEATDKYLRLYSEFDNFRKRTQKEKVELYKTAGEDVISALLPIIDDFERAQKAMEKSDDIQGVKDGVKLIHDKLINILKQKGLEAVESAIGKDFDVEKHEAITQIPAPTEKEKGKVIDEVEKGYHLNGKVIRYAKVVVGQ